jgi:hypothetical protein
MYPDSGKNQPLLIHFKTGHRIQRSQKLKRKKKGLQIYNYFHYSTTDRGEYMKLF